MTQYFGTDGIRLHAEEFSFNFLAAVIDGLIRYRGDSNFSLLLGGDTRLSTGRILGDLETIAGSRGLHCISIGVFPTPGINFYLGHAKYDFAIDVTASHNPASYNGLKVLELRNGQPAKLCAEGRQLIEESLQLALRAPNTNAATPSPAQTPVAPSSAEDRHTEALISYTSHLRTYIGDCDFSKLKIALDCANGATSIIGDELFRELGAETTLIHADTNFGVSINDACGSTHLDSLRSTVTDNHLDFGFAFDGDGDRCLVIDAEGNTVDGDKILAILSDYLGLKGIVVTLMTNQGILNWAKDHHINVEVSDVGDQNVYALMLEKGFKLGGEQSGHIILPYESMGDGMLTALMMTKVISERREDLAKIAAAIPSYPQFTLNIPATKEQKSHLSTPAVSAIIDKYSSLLAERQGRLLVRPSGTEDLIRLTLWGNESIDLEELASRLATELQAAL